MCEKEIHQMVYTPCSICVVEDCEPKKKYPKTHGCGYGKVSNEMIKWAFEFTNHLRSLGQEKEKPFNNFPTVEFK